MVHLVRFRSPASIVKKLIDCRGWKLEHGGRCYFSSLEYSGNWWSRGKLLKGCCSIKHAYINTMLMWKVQVAREKNWNYAAVYIRVVYLKRRYQVTQSTQTIIIIIIIIISTIIYCLVNTFFFNSNTQENILVFLSRLFYPFSWIVIRCSVTVSNSCQS